MRADADLLIVGSTTLRKTVAEALPRCRCVPADSLLNGVWTAGQGRFEGVLLEYVPGDRLLRAIRALRKVAPQARIVVAVPPAHEPHGQRATEAGADEYILEPITPEELANAFQIPRATAPTRVESPPPGPTPEEAMALADVLQRLNEGPAAALERLAGLIRAALGAVGVQVRVEDLVASTGQTEDPVLEEVLRRGEVVVGSVALGRKQGGAYTAEDARRLAGYARLVEAVVTQADEQRRWRELAWRDDLSGLHNRRYLEARLEELVRDATARRQRLTVLLFDIDDFKTYNDRYGHETGDALIREVATLLTRCSREHDVVARYGGDEFAVIFWDAEKPRVPGSQHPNEPVALADRFRDVIRKHAFKCLGPEAPGPITISGGLACFPWDGKTPTELLRAADEALLAAKRTGKNRIALANGGLTPERPTTA